MMLGVIRSRLVFSTNLMNLLRPSQVINQSTNGDLTPKHLCQQCDAFTPNCSNSTRLFGTLNSLEPFIPSGLWRSENRERLMKCNQFSMLDSISGGPFYMQTRGMKYKGKVKRRCKDCFLMWVNGMLYNLCNTHPRHKHGLQPPLFCTQRLLTHATQKPKRPW